MFEDWKDKLAYISFMVALVLIFPWLLKGLDTYMRWIWSF